MKRYIPMLELAFAVVLALGLTACQTPISANLKQDMAGAGGGTGGIIAADMQATAWNLDQAVSVGALSADDPAPACAHGFLLDSGLEQMPGAEPAKSFVPKNDGLLSFGSILYIRAQQLKAMKGSGGDLVPASCDALIGKFVRDAFKGGIKAGSALVPGSGLLQPIMGLLAK